MFRILPGTKMVQEDFFDALCRVGGDGGGFRVCRASGHTAVLVVRDTGIDTGWANEQQA